MTTYQEAVLQGNSILIVQQSIITASLWAIGSSWATAIREVSLSLLPDITSTVFAELCAAFLTTGLAIAITLFVIRSTKFVNKTQKAIKPIMNQRYIARITKNEKR